MPWPNPPTSPFAYADYAKAMQFPLALRKRHQALGQCDWPPPSPIFDTGMITDAETGSGNSIVITCDSTNLTNWTTNQCDGIAGGAPTGWFAPTPGTCDCSPTGNGKIFPGTFDLVIVVDTTDNRTVVRGSITAQNVSTPSITINGLGGAVSLGQSTCNCVLNAITAGFIPDLAALVGATYYVVNSGGGYVSDERLPPQPNDNEVFKGYTNINGYLTTSGGDAGYLSQTFDDFSGKPIAWAANRWQNNYLLAFDQNGLLYRLEITSNDGQNLYLGGALPLSGTVTIQSGGTVLTTGTIASGVIDTGGNGWLTVTGAGWTTNAYNGKTAHVGSAIYNITSNTSDTLALGFFPGKATATTLGESSNTGYLIVADDTTKAMPGRVFWKVSTWYSGANDTFNTHLPSDTIGAVPADPLTGLPKYYYAKSSDSISDGDICVTCTTAAVNLKDEDVFLPSAGYCNAGQSGNPYTPTYWWSMRSWQVDALRDLSPQYVQLPSGGGTGNLNGQSSIANYFPATILNACGINAWTSSFSYDHTTGKLTLAAITPGSLDPHLQYPISALFCVNQWNGNGTDQSAGGTTTIASDGTATSIAAQCLEYAATSGTTSFTGSVTLSMGLSRSKPLGFQRLYYSTVFLPNANDGGTLKDPPAYATTDCAGVGVWAKQAPSQYYREFDDGGFAQETHNDWLGGSPYGIPFISGDKARYQGNNADDPTYYQYLSGGIYNYYDHYVIGHLSPVNYALRQAAIKGTATAGTDRSITDTNQHWWGTPWGAKSVGASSTSANTLRTATYTAGSSTGAGVLKATAATGDACWFASGRFVGFAAPYANFSVTYTHASIAYTCRITSAGISGSTVTLNIDQPTGYPNPASGDSFTLLEPAYMINCWEGRSLQLTDPTGAVHTVPILANDDQHIFFAAVTGYTPGAGWAYKIVEIPVGTVCQWSGSDWVATTDTRPTAMADYGYRRRGDYNLLKEYQELMAVINQELWTPEGGTWSNSPTLIGGDTGVSNYYSGGYELGDFFGVPATCAQASSWTTVTGTSFSQTSTDSLTVVPFVDILQKVTLGFDPGCVCIGPGPGPWAATGTAAYSYMWATVPTCLACTVDFYTWADNPGGTIDYDCSDGIPTKKPTIFDDFGAQVSNQAWKTFGTSGPAQVANPVSPALGYMSFPPISATVIPTCCCGGNSTCEIQATTGFYVENWTAICKWDMSPYAP